METHEILKGMKTLKILSCRLAAVTIITLRDRERVMLAPKGAKISSKLSDRLIILMCICQLLS